MKFRRRQYIINAGMQMKYTLRFVLIALAGSLAATTVFNYYALKDLELAMYRTHTVHTTTADIIAPLFIYTNIVNIAFVLLLLVIIASWMMRKASGPVFRMSKDLLQVADGDLSTKIILRTKDEFKDVAEELNIMLKSMHDRINKVQIKYKDISNSIKTMETAADESLLNDIKLLETELENLKLSKSERVS